MSKRIVAKLAVTFIALVAATLLQGCGQDDDLMYSFVWAPGAMDTAPAVFQVSSTW